MTVEVAPFVLFRGIHRSVKPVHKGGKDGGKVVLTPQVREPPGHDKGFTQLGELDKVTSD